MCVCVCACSCAQVECLGMSSGLLPLSSPPCDMWSPGISHRHYNHKHTSPRRGEPEREDKRVGKRAPRTEEGRGEGRRGRGRGSCQSNLTDSSAHPNFVCLCLFVLASAQLFGRKWPLIILRAFRRSGSSLNPAVPYALQPRKQDQLNVF